MLQLWQAWHQCSRLDDKLITNNTKTAIYLYCISRLSCVAMHTEKLTPTQPAAGSFDWPLELQNGDIPWRKCYCATFMYRTVTYEFYAFRFVVYNRLILIRVIKEVHDFFA